MKSVCIVTTTRAEYGLLKNVIRLIRDDEDFNLELVASGTHLSKEWGLTVDEIIDDGFDKLTKIEILSDLNGKMGVAMTMSIAMSEFAKFFETKTIDILIVLGDRYELIPIVSTALIYNIPVAHISGGEITEGAIDDYIRNAVTKMSYLHFPACEEYKKRIIQMGENPDRVFNFGDLGVENIKKTKLLSRLELSQKIKFDLSKPYFCVTYHPVTFEGNRIEYQLRNLFDAIDKYKDEYSFIFTSSNADEGGKIINEMISLYLESNRNSVLYSSLGVVKYLSLMRYSTGVIGNSSSGIIEAPSLGVPTINIGNRQKGRMMASSIINCGNDTNDIVAAIEKCIKGQVDYSYIPYDGRDTSINIVNNIKSFLLESNIDLKKRFYDIEFEEI